MHFLHFLWRAGPRDETPDSRGCPVAARLRTPSLRPAPAAATPASDQMYKYASTWPALSRLLGSWANNCGLTACMPPPMTPNLADDFLSEDEDSEED